MTAERAREENTPHTGGVDDIGMSILSLVAHNEEKYEEPVGKTRLRKTFFLMTEELPCFRSRLNYKPKNHGPYSDTLEKCMAYLIDRDMLDERHESGYKKNLYITEHGRKLLGGALSNIGNDVIILLPQINDFLNGMSHDEMLAYVDLKYPGMAKNSDKYHDLIKPNALIPVMGLIEKRKITAQCGAELLGITYTEMYKKLGERLE
ncbi:hypothetical protein IBTHAUMO2_990033 [Nitrosopumilaceae archaeon]|nr:hypothetical protein [Nitrosopumilus sp.]CAI9832801.1 hypothetical protein IBTHAUMO2_990033 [Nitrosopumilaceae archaeon]MDA7944381.1 hypothetical protein [Nitrosopumilus sp.]MDA7954133.1 hypothetical protein [Nitrosopumilus sp.]MDA7973061.1 hypothetical protein [Nitrosopumilus sp.]